MEFSIRRLSEEEELNNPLYQGDGFEDEAYDGEMTYKRL